MGKAKERRKKWRLRYLITLRATNAEAFKEEVDKRIASWTQEIWDVAERGIINGVRTFALAEQAETLVSETGQPVAEILEQECCRALSAKQGLNKHRLVAAYDPACANRETE